MPNATILKFLHLTNVSGKNCYEFPFKLVIRCDGLTLRDHWVKIKNIRCSNYCKFLSNWKAR